MRFTDDYLQTRYVNIKSDKVFNDFKMMVIGDIHMSFMVSLSKIKTIKEKIVKFIVNMTSEYKRIYEMSSRYPDIALVILRQAFSNAVYNNRRYVSFRDIYDAIRFTKAVYPDVIKKELVVFANEFKDELKAENIVVDANNYLHE